MGIEGTIQRPHDSSGTTNHIARTDDPSNQGQTDILVTYIRALRSILDAAFRTIPCRCLINLLWQSDPLGMFVTPVASVVEILPHARLRINFPFEQFDSELRIITPSPENIVFTMAQICKFSFCFAICWFCCSCSQAQNLNENGFIRIASAISKVEDTDYIENTDSSPELLPHREEVDLSTSTNLVSPCPAACSGKKRSVYTSLNLAGSFNHLSSGGYNTSGGFNNSGSDIEDTFDIGGAIGVSVPRNWGTMRLECEAMGRDIFNSVTDSFAPPTPTFFYDVAVENRWTALANVWFDVPWRNCTNVYIGGGLGTGGGTLSIDDGVVQGYGGFTEGVWQFGFGVTRQRNKRLTFDLGYRFVDFGTAEIGILNGTGGNYTLETTSHQITLGVRFNSIRQLLTRR